MRGALLLDHSRQDARIAEQLGIGPRGLAALDHGATEDCTGVAVGRVPGSSAPDLPGVTAQAGTNFHRFCRLLELLRNLAPELVNYRMRVTIDRGILTNPLVCDFLKRTQG